MKIAYNWLKKYIQIDKSAEKLGELLTAGGLEVEGIELYEQVPGGLEGVVIGEVLTCEKHENATKLSVTKVDVGGEEPLPIVCGAPNVAQGQKVLVATVNTKLYPNNGEPFTIKKAKIRGEISQGMICAEDELGLGVSHDGIMVLDTDLPNGTPAKHYLNLAEDEVFEIGLTPNRADATSHIGVARDIKALLDTPLCKPSVENFQIDNHDFPIKIKVENQKACPRYAGLTISNITIKKSPEWLQNHLKSIGLSPINNVVDITNFVLHETGQPLHAFDANQIGDKQILVKTLPHDTKFVSLDQEERLLNEHDLMICDGKGKGMCIGGVFGGIDSGVTENTTHIFLESAYFSPDYIRRTAQYHGLKTDASFRFERGVDPNNTVYALKRAALLIKELAGGEISSEITDIYPNPIQPFLFKVNYKNIYRLIGKEIDSEFIKKTLTNLEIKISEETSVGFQVSVPPYRVDVQREVDIIEELARLYGYDNIEISDNLGSEYLADFPLIDTHKIQYQITQLLAANGFSEMMNNSLTKPSYIETTDAFSAENNIEIFNKLSEDLGVMRQTLLFSGLEVLAHNLNRRQKDLKFFEFGKIYSQQKEREGLNKYQEEKKLAIFMTGNQRSETWQNPGKKTAFHDIAAIVIKVLQRLNKVNIQTQPTENSLLAYGVCYKDKEQVLGEVGMLSSSITQSLNIQQEVFYADLNWEYLLKKYKEEVTYEEVSKFPEVRRDLSLVLDKTVSFQEIKELALKTERKLLKTINVFDVYEGKNIEEHKKAYALSFILEDKKQSMTTKTIEKTMKKLMNIFKQELNAIIRE